MGINKLLQPSLAFAVLKGRESIALLKYLANSKVAFNSFILEYTVLQNWSFPNFF